MVKVTEAILSAYCDFCGDPTNKTDDKEISKSKDRKRSYRSCSICHKDVCERHYCEIKLPKIPENSTREFERFCMYRSSIFSDGLICPECANLPLGKIGILLLEAMRRTFRTEAR